MKDSKLTVSDILNLTPEQLAETQLNTLQTAALEIIEEFANKIRQKRYAEAQEMLELSASGDGYGNDNYFLNMRSLGSDICDMGDVLERLSALQDIVQFAATKKIPGGKNCTKH